jgi:hypothetical protein
VAAAPEALRPGEAAQLPALEFRPRHLALPAANHLARFGAGAAAIPGETLQALAPEGERLARVGDRCPARPLGLDVEGRLQ